MSKSAEKRSSKRVELLLDLYRTDRARFDVEMRRRIQNWLQLALRCLEPEDPSTGEKISFSDNVARIEREIKALTDAEKGLSRLAEVGPLLRAVATHVRAREFDSRLYRVTVNFQHPLKTGHSGLGANSAKSLGSRARKSPPAAATGRSGADSQS